MFRLDDPGQALAMVERLASLGVLISSLELLIHPGQLADAALMSWPVSRLREPWLATGLVAATLNAVVPYPRILAIIALRAGAAGLMATGLLLPALHGYAIAAVAISSLLLIVRSPQGLDGADQMTLVTFSGLLLARLCHTRSGDIACVWFIAGQACLSYFTAGTSKMFSAEWRDGLALTNVFTARIYGHALLGRHFIARPRHAVWASWSIIIFETAFPAVLFASPEYAIWFLFGGVAFHGMAALTMGLNTFFWAFVATYPAVLCFCSN